MGKSATKLNTAVKEERGPREVTTEEKEERDLKEAIMDLKKNVNGSANPNTLYTHLHTHLLLTVTKFAAKSEVPREVKEVRVLVTTVHIMVVKEEKEERVITVSSTKNVNGSANPNTLYTHLHTHLRSVIRHHSVSLVSVTECNSPSAVLSLPILPLL